MPRSNQTKRLLAQSLMDLMTTTPLEKISGAIPFTIILRISTIW